MGQKMWGKWKVGGFAALRMIDGYDSDYECRCSFKYGIDDRA